MLNFRKGTSLRGTALFGVLDVKIGSGRWKNPKKPSKHFDAQFRSYGEKKPLE